MTEGLIIILTVRKCRDVSCVELSRSKGIIGERESSLCEAPVMG